MTHRQIARAEVGIVPERPKGRCMAVLTLRRPPATTASFKTGNFAQPADAEEMAKHERRTRNPMTESIPDALDVAVSHHTRQGDQRVDAMLGIHSMPFGYALLLDANGIYFRWLRYDGLEGPELLTMWSAYNSAKWNRQTALSVVMPMPIVAVPHS